MPSFLYAQIFEEVILWSAQPKVVNGIYVERGAVDPEEYSSAPL
jgi:hypothetical protein